MGNWGYNPCKWSFLLITGGGPLCTWCYFSFFCLLLHDGLSFIGRFECLSLMAEFQFTCFWIRFETGSDLVFTSMRMVGEFEAGRVTPMKGKRAIEESVILKRWLGRGLKDCQTLVDPTQKRRVVCRVVNVFFYIRTVLESTAYWVRW